MMNTLQSLLDETAYERPLVMGILNVTPDSFSDGGRFMQLSNIIQQVETMLSAGVDIIDVGGESTRPGAASVSLSEELDRVVPVIEWLKENQDVLISLDTYKTDVMKAGLALGVDMINDVNALQSAGAVELLAGCDAHVCLMHKQGVSKTMQDAPSYEDVVSEVIGFLNGRVDVCIGGGVKKERLLLDPGFGFGKDLQHNMRLFEELDKLVDLHYPTLIGVSRKKMIGQILAMENEMLPVSERVNGSVAAAMIAAMKGARVLRVHDVKETVDALKIMQALL